MPFSPASPRLSGFLFVGAEKPSGRPFLAVFEMEFIDALDVHEFAFAGLIWKVMVPF
jgi:hypothetical protein